MIRGTSFTFAIFYEFQFWDYFENQKISAEKIIVSARDHPISTSGIWTSLKLNNLILIYIGREFLFGTFLYVCIMIWSIIFDFRKNNLQSLSQQSADDVARFHCTNCGQSSSFNFVESVEQDVSNHMNQDSPNMEQVKILFFKK